MKNKKTRIKDRLTENKRKILTKEKTIYLISALIIIIAIATYIIWPFRYNIVISNEKEDFVLSSVEIVNHKGKIVSEEYGYNISTKLWKGEYKVSIKAKGYQDIDINIDNKIGPRFNKDISNEIKLKPKLINISTIRYTDPTEYLDLSPEMHAIGKNILGDLVDINYNHNEEIIYGDYMLYLSDPYFEADARLEGDVFYQDNVKRKKIRMSPNDKFIILNVDEIENIMNYMDDFLELSYDGVLSKSEKGFPRQFYLYKKDQIVSLGNMIFLSCQKRTFDVQNIQEDKRTYFVSKQQDIFRFVNESENIKECYADILKGEVPRKIGSEKISDVIYREVTREENTKDYEIGLLNSDKKGIDIGFTFDIESGRYVWEDDGLSISPCQDEDYSVGLESEEIVCDRPEFVAWMSPRDDDITYTEFSYPQVSGILGYREIIDYSLRYGIPTTQFFVKKDILAFEELDPGLVENAKRLVDEGLIEVGSHTRYHTYLGLVEKDVALQEMIESRIFLEEFFNTTVYGFRAPYLTKVGNDETVHTEAVEEAGYRYFSSLSMYFSKVKWHNVFHKPWNTGGKYAGMMSPDEFKGLMEENEYIITLDHPWNIVYDDGMILKENKDTKKSFRANVLTAINNGGRLVKVKDLRLTQSQIK